MLLFFFCTNKEFRDMYTCSVNMFTVRMDVCMYLHVYGSIQKKYPSILFPHSLLLLSLSLPFLLRLLNLFILLMTF